MNGEEIKSTLKKYSLQSWSKQRNINAAYITFFPVAINMLSGMNSVESDKKELLYSYAAK